jgi:signal peptidase I
VTTPETDLNPDDPGWVDAILARARQRLEEGHSVISATVAGGGTAASAPAEPSPAVVAAPVATAPVAAAPEPAPAPEADPVVVVATEPEPASVFAPAAAATVSADERVAATQPEPEPGGTADDDPFATLRPDDTKSGSKKASPSWRGWVEWIAVAVGALIVALVIRAFLFQAFYIPSESMEPTLVKSDRILVNKLSYKVHDVHRGDLVVFEKPPGQPKDNINDLIKRVVATGGETVEQRDDGYVYIDGTKLVEPYVAGGLTAGTPIRWIKGCANPQSETTKCQIPAGHVWVMGDNRAHSLDSRYFGPIDEHLIVGRAFVKFWPLSGIGLL